MRTGSLATALVAILLAGAAAACSTKKNDSDTAAAAATSAPTCPKAWRAGWQRLANRIHAPVYCPAWLPDPLTGQIGGPWGDINSVSKRDRSYLIGFLWQERDSGEIHVNLRGYPGRTAVPTCTDTYTAADKTRYARLPCFSDAQPVKRVGGLAVTEYRVNQGADQWHILYAWHRGRSLYTISEHVAPPLSAAQVVKNLNRMTKSLQLIQPSAS
jgi:hypothetical protein